VSRLAVHGNPSDTLVE